MTKTSCSKDEIGYEFLNESEKNTFIKDILPNSRLKQIDFYDIKLDNFAEHM